MLPQQIHSPERPATRAHAAAARLDVLDAVIRARNLEDRLATACVGVLEPARRRLTVASAGHPLPILLGLAAQLVDITPGPPLGLPPELRPQTWEAQTVAVDRTFSVVLYTDRLIEGRRAPGSSLRQGEESLTAWLDASIAVGAVSQEQRHQVVADVQSANGGPLLDDATVVVLTASAPSRVPPPRDLTVTDDERAEPVDSFPCLINLDP